MLELITRAATRMEDVFVCRRHYQCAFVEGQLAYGPRPDLRIYDL